MKRLLLSFVPLLFLSCTDPYYGRVQEIPLSFSTYQEAWIWVTCNISYKSDKEVHGKAEEWQTPLETYERRTGDCEDISILLCYFLKSIGNTSLVEAVDKSTGLGHAFVKFNGFYLESSVYGVYIDVRRYNVIREISYETALKTSYYRSIK